MIRHTMLHAARRVMLNITYNIDPNVVPVPYNVDNLTVHKAVNEATRNVLEQRYIMHSVFHGVTKFRFVKWYKFELCFSIPMFRLDENDDHSVLFYIKKDLEKFGFQAIWFSDISEDTAYANVHRHAEL